MSETIDAIPTTVIPNPIDVDQQIEYFRRFDIVEKFDIGKKYEQGSFTYDSRWGERRYHWLFVEFVNAETNESCKYAVAEEDDLEEIKRLAPYCQCAVCSARWYQLNYYFGCAHCSGCLKGRGHQPSVKEKTKQYIVSLKQ